MKYFIIVFFLWNTPIFNKDKIFFSPWKNEYKIQIDTNEYIYPENVYRYKQNKVYNVKLSNDGKIYLNYFEKNGNSVQRVSCAYLVQDLSVERVTAYDIDFRDSILVIYVLTKGAKNLLLSTRLAQHNGFKPIQIQTEKMHFFENLKPEEIVWSDLMIYEGNLCVYNAFGEIYCLNIKKGLITAYSGKLPNFFSEIQLFYGYNLIPNSANQYVC